MYKTLIINEKNSIESIIELDLLLNIPKRIEIDSLPDNIKFQIETRSEKTDELLHLENILITSTQNLMEKSEKNLFQEFKGITETCYLLIELDYPLNSEIFSKILSISNPYVHHFYVSSINEYHNLLTLILNRGVYIEEYS